MYAYTYHTIRTVAVRMHMHTYLNAFPRSVATANRRHSRVGRPKSQRGFWPLLPQEKKENASLESTPVQLRRAAHLRFAAGPRSREAGSLSRRHSFHLRRANCLQSQACSLLFRVCATTSLGAFTWETRRATHHYVLTHILTYAGVHPVLGQVLRRDGWTVTDGRMHRYFRRNVGTVPETRHDLPGVERQNKPDLTGRSRNFKKVARLAQEERGVERCAAARTIAPRAIKLCNREQRDQGPTCVHRKAQDGVRSGDVCIQLDTCSQGCVHERLS